MAATGVAGRAGEITRAEVLRAGRRRFLAGERLDMLGVAKELGIARATMYRWFGDRDRFAGHVLWSLASDTLEAEIKRGRGVIDPLLATLKAITTHAAFQAYLAQDPPRAMVILTGRDSLVAGGMRDRLEALILAEHPQAVTAALPAGELAYALVRLAESYCYADIIAGRAVDVEQARPLFHRLLEVP